MASGSGGAGPSGWDSLQLNLQDPEEVRLGALVQQAALGHVAPSSSRAYACAWKAFVSWCSSLAQPRCPLPAAEITVAMYLQLVVGRSKSYSPFKKASAAIAFFQKVNLHNHLPTRAPAVEMVRQAAIRNFGLAPKNRKAPFS